MFNQKEYVNSYIKQNYRTIKLRIRKEDKLLLNKIDNVDNINKYILDLIRKDILEHRTYNYIDDSIKIDFELSKTMQDLVDKAEEADLLDNYGIYMNIADAIDSQAKLEVTHHRLRESEWNKLVKRYCL